VRRVSDDRVWKEVQALENGGDHGPFESLRVGGRREAVEDAAVVEHAVEHEGVVMGGEIDGRTEPLHEHDRAGMGRVHAVAAGLRAHEANDRAHEAGV